MVNKPEISVLMCVYNTPLDVLSQSILSILNQDFRNFEFVIVNDGSNAETLALLEGFADVDSRIILVNNSTNIGLTASLNVGLTYCRGRFLARQDADDVSVDGRLKAQLEFFICHPQTRILFTNSSLIDSNGDNIGLIHSDRNASKIHRRNVFVHGSLFVRTNDILDIGGYDASMVLAQDYELYLRLISMHGACYSVLPELLYKLRISKMSLSSRLPIRQYVYAWLAKKKNSSIKNIFVRNFLYVFIFIFDFVYTHRLLIPQMLRSSLR